MLSNYQNFPNGGNGYLRILTFDCIQNQLHIKTFSPYLNTYKTDSSSQFSLHYPLNGSSTFTVIALPDTQYYSASHPEIFINQTTWIVENRQLLNIVFVVHLGDIVDQFNDQQQWDNSKEALNILAFDGIPYSVLPGNHDIVSWENNFDSYYYQYYGPQKFMQNSYYGGDFNGDNFNNYAFFEYYDNKFLVLNLQNDPPQPVLNWANNIVDLHTDRQVILCTHEFCSSSGRTPIGQNIWDNLVKNRKDQINIVLCGHYPGESFYSMQIIPDQYEVLLTSKQFFVGDIYVFDF